MKAQDRISLITILSNGFLENIKEHIETWMRAKGNINSYIINYGHIIFEDYERLPDNEIEEIIKRIVLIYFRQTEDIFIKRPGCRKRELVQTRQIIMTFLHEYANYTDKIIGYVCGNLDHATSFHSRKTVKNLYETNREFREIYNYLDSEIRKAIGINA